MLVLAGDAGGSWVWELPREVDRLEPMLSKLDAGITDLGINIRQMLEHFGRTEFRFVSRIPKRFIIPDFSGPYRSYLGSVFGTLPAGFRELLMEDFSDALEIETVDCTAADALPLLDSENIFPLRIGELHGDVVEDYLQLTALMVLDPRSLIDIQDHWNIRALGLNTIPVPVQYAGDETYLAATINRLLLQLKEEKVTPRHSQEIPIFKGRSVDVEEYRACVEQLMEMEDLEALAGVAHFHPRSYPEIWDNPEGERVTFEARRGRVTFTDMEGALKIYPLSPEFASFSIGPAFANHMDLYLWSNKDLLANVFPKHDVNVANYLAKHSEKRAWRISAHGPVYMGSRQDDEVYIPIPYSHDVFIEWMSSMGWEAELSTPGRIQLEALRHLGGGRFGIGLLSSQELVEFSNVHSDGKAISEEECMDKMENAIKASKLQMKPAELVNLLVEKRALQLGVRLQCQHCGRRSWYSLKEFDYELTCQLCLREFLSPRVPTRSDESVNWAYRTTGPFSLPGYGGGSYSVLLTLRLLEAGIFFRDATPMLSFELRKGDRKFEIDLGMFTDLSRVFRPRSEQFPVFVEAKSLHRFKPRDSDKMLEIATEFPNSFLVFSMLRPSLGSNEKKRLRSLRNKLETIEFRNRRPVKPLIILTELELFSANGPPSCWDQLENKPPTLEDGFHYDISSLCQVTQELYL